MYAVHVGVCKLKNGTNIHTIFIIEFIKGFIAYNDLIIVKSEFNSVSLSLKIAFSEVIWMIIQGELTETKG